MSSSYNRDINFYNSSYNSDINFYYSVIYPELLQKAEDNILKYDKPYINEELNLILNKFHSITLFMTEQEYTDYFNTEIEFNIKKYEKTYFINEELNLILNNMTDNEFNNYCSNYQHINKNSNEWFKYCSTLDFIKKSKLNSEVKARRKHSNKLINEVYETKPPKQTNNKTVESDNNDLPIQQIYKSIKSGEFTLLRIYKKIEKAILNEHKLKTILINNEDLYTPTEKQRSYYFNRLEKIYL
jgi:hypothetical protein